jgi:hypothetical protein
LFNVDEATSNNCFYTSTLLDPAHATSSVSSPAEFASVYTGDSLISFKTVSNTFFVNKASHAQAIDLLDTFLFPKMCARRSVNLTIGVTLLGSGLNEKSFTYNIASMSGAG